MAAGRKTMETLTDSMFYVLMALTKKPMRGMKIASTIDLLTENRVKIGPATLYTGFARFEKDDILLRQLCLEGSALIKIGQKAYVEECERLEVYLRDAEKFERSCE